MGFSLADIAKDNKQLIFALLGLGVVAVVMAVASREGGVLNFSTNLTGGGVGDVTGNGSNDGNTTTDSSDDLPTFTLEPGKDYKAKIYTNYGEITVDLYEDKTPIAVGNFVYLVNKGFYDDLAFHRVISGFIIQGGDPNGNGTGGPGYTFIDEIDANALGLNNIKVKDATYINGLYPSNTLSEYADKSLKVFYEEYSGYTYKSGVGGGVMGNYSLVMANSGANTNGSQFFIVLHGADVRHLDGRHTVFGEVSEGLSVVDKIGLVDVDASNKPKIDVIIEKVEIFTN